MKRVLTCAIICLFAVSTAMAVDVTVNSTQPEVAGSNYQTISAAMNYVKAQPEPRIVRVTGGGPYLEAAGVEIDYSVTLAGDGYKPLFIFGPTDTAGVSASNKGNGIYIFVGVAAPADTHIDVVLKNFILIPDKTNTPAYHGIRANTDTTGLSVTATLSIFIENVVVTANDGADNPVTTDGFTPTTAPPGIKRFGSRGMYFSGHINDLQTTGTICSWNRIDGAVYVPDDYTGRTSYNPILIGPGCVFSFNGRNGMYLNSDGTPANLLGTAANPIWIYANRTPGTYDNWQGALGFWHDDNNRPECVYTLKYVNVVGNNEIAIHTGYTDSDASLAELNAENCFIANNAGAGIFLSGELTGGGTPAGVSEFKRAWTFKNCTFANNGPATTGTNGEVAASPRLAAGPLTVASSAFANPATAGITFIDCIVAGNAASVDASDNRISLAKPLAVTFQNSGIVRAGALVLGAPTLGAGAVAPTETSCVSINPMFLDTADPFAANFYAVDNPAFAGLESDGGNLSGAGLYVGSFVPPTGSTIWGLYE